MEKRIKTRLEIWKPNKKAGPKTPEFNIVLYDKNFEDYKINHTFIKDVVMATTGVDLNCTDHRSTTYIVKKYHMIWIDSHDITVKFSW